MSHRTVMVALALPLLCIPACVAKQESRLETRHEVVSQAMSGHLGEAAHARDAVIAGDLEATQRALLELRARLPLPSLPPQGLRHDAVFVVAVDSALTARDLGSAATAVGEIAQACGACHTALGLSMAVVPPAEPGPGATVVARMGQHRDAAAQMWSSVVAGDAAAFASGAELLRSSTLVPSGTAADAPVPALAAELEVRVHDLAALAVRSPDERGRYLGQMLGTCAQCHALLARGPEAP